MSRLPTTWAPTSADSRGRASARRTRSRARRRRWSCSSSGPQLDREVTLTRAATEIGAGLAPAREARTIRAGELIHVVGAAGAGASAAALLAHDAGARVTGCDRGGPSPYTVALDAAGIRIGRS